MKPVHLALSTVVALALAGAAGCADGDADDRARDWELNGSGEKPGDVAPDAPDGTKTSSACTPKTCEQLGKTSGTAEDGCGQTLTCGDGNSSPACSDEKGNNHTREAAADLGEMDDRFDFGFGDTVIPDLTLGDGEEDWFRVKVSDVGLNGNPRVTAAAPNAEVSIFYVCDAKGDASECPNTTDKPDNLIGKGCRGNATVTLKAYCETWNESGTAFIRVRKAAPNGQCTTYTLTVDVD
jgi:hypothetical protein